MSSTFDDDCDWPRRLLHVPTMTSIPWAPGDRYGDVAKPKYLAITYTWGRWRLRDDEQIEVQALPVQGVTWTVPRVSPAHFTAVALQECLGIILEEASTRSPLAPIIDQDSFEFVWLDIACIDQNPDSPDAAAEIGRQAKIFHGACYVYAWLTTLEYDTITRLFSHGNGLDEWEAKMEQSSNDNVADLENVLSADFVHYLTSDPWFTSLWTLQEAYLCPEAYIMTKDVRHSLWADRTPEKDQPALDLKSLISLFEMTWNYTGSQLRSHISYNSNWTEDHLGQIRKAIEMSGLLELADGCPTSLLAAARYRKTGPDNTTDRVYGIMQVFNLRLGKSRPGARPYYNFSLNELEDELGLALMSKDPVLSQLFTYQAPPPLGKGWRVTDMSRSAAYGSPSASLSSIYIELGYTGLDKRRGMANNLIAPTLFTSAKFNETTCAQFKGLTVTLNSLHSFFHALLANDKKGWYRDLFTVAVDSPKKKQVIWGPDENEINPSVEEIERLLVQSPDALVLLLGRYYSSHLHRAFALIVVPHKQMEQHQSIWRRAGICSWKISHNLVTEVERPFMQGQDSAWACTEGILA